MENSSAPSIPSKPSPPAFYVRLLAMGFFAGYSPFAPGTAGSIVGLAIYFIPGMETPIALSIASLAGFFSGVGVSTMMTKQLGEDPPVVVIDEIVGMWISLILLPKTLAVALLAFLFFRIYDIFKPPPARRMERVRDGWGIMLDDVVAAVYANVSVRLILIAVPTIG